MADPQPIRRALYDPLPIDPDSPERDCYRLLAMGRSVTALDRWYDPTGERFQRRGTTIAAELERIIE